ncbi:MAG: 16S rRNA (cytosine(1402)-N(4))-methyltransferase RsmH [Candidatus Vogelbacteria bacterium]|nr:16S rRNA (cytosine(1402)-N(4))-methyltransferase RsmH [Candidatus Vogelbacteria bacterium]
MHIPVLLQEVIEGLALTAGLTVLDATINGAGHSAEISKRIPGGCLIGLDRDRTALAKARQRLQNAPCRVILKQGNFRHLDQILDTLQIVSFDRCLFDLGLSSDQLAESGRGFSFLKDEPLTMTYEVEPVTITARTIVNESSAADLELTLKEYGEEPFATSIARAIVAARKKKKIETTKELVAIIRSAVPAWYRSARRRKHFATQTFQALRIAVNDEFRALTEGLNHGWRYLAPGGRLAVISFHSGEARIVKKIFPDHRKIKPTRTEIKNNPRARSAVLRLIQKS